MHISIFDIDGFTAFNDETLRAESARKALVSDPIGMQILLWVAQKKISIDIKGSHINHNRLIERIHAMDLPHEMS